MADIFLHCIQTVQLFMELTMDFNAVGGTLAFFSTRNAKLKNAKEPPSQRTSETEKRKE